MSKSWRILARYSGDGGYWSDDVEADSSDEAEAIAKEIMEENGEDDPDSIEIIDCDEVDATLRAKDRAIELSAALRQAIGRLSIHEVDPAWNSLLHHVYGAEWLASNG